MHAPDLSRRLVAEAFGTSLFTYAVFVSGAVATRLSGGPNALSLLCTTITVGATLGLLTTLFKPLSGAHFNPSVTLSQLLLRRMAILEAILYVIAQLCGSVAGLLVAIALIGESVSSVALPDGIGRSMMLPEIFATFGLVMVLIGAMHWRQAAIGATAGTYVAAVFWFTTSSNYANPLITAMQMAADQSHSGGEASLSICGQLAAAVLATLLCGWLFSPRRPRRKAERG